MGDVPPWAFAVAPEAEEDGLGPVVAADGEAQGERRATRNSPERAAEVEVMRVVDKPVVFHEVTCLCYYKLCAGVTAGLAANPRR